MFAIVVNVEGVAKRSSECPPIRLLEYELWQFCQGSEHTLVGPAIPGAHIGQVQISVPVSEVCVARLVVIQSYLLMGISVYSIIQAIF